MCLGKDGKCSRNGLILRDADPGFPIIFPKPPPAVIPKPVVPIGAKPIPLVPKPKDPVPANPNVCKRSDCNPGGIPPQDPPGPPPAPAHPPAGDNAIPPHVDKPTTGQDIHNNLRGAIARNEPEVIRPPYTQNYARDMVRANEPRIQVPLSDSRVKDMFQQQGFRVREKAWKPAVMDSKDFKFNYDKPEKPGTPDQPGTPETESSQETTSTTDSGSYRYGAPMVENYHDMEQGSIITKSQLKSEGDTGLPFSEKSYQMVREDFNGNIGSVKRIGISDIVNEGWLDKAKIYLRDTPDFEWETFQRGTPGYNDFLATDNGKWIGYMLTDHHGPMNNKDIVSIAVAKEVIPDGSYKGFMSIVTGAPQ
jgi:hypothetical protein